MELTGRVRLFDATALYDVLAADRAFSGSELNLEGAVVDGPSLRLFQRGNGATIDGREPIDATVTKTKP